ncbi:hypothetical protein ABPG75_005187 [Micractinium tetrahymenae]
MLAACQAQLCARPASHAASSGPAGRTAAAPARAVNAAAGRRPVRAAAAPGGKDGEELPPSLPRVAAPADVPDKDFWEGDQFNLLGDAASLLIPILAVAAVGVGIFASQTYNEGATVFLDAPKSAEDTARLVPAQQLKQP